MSSLDQVQYVNPEALHKNPAFTNVVVVTGLVKTVYVCGQEVVDASGNIIGKGDLKAQTDQVLKNIQAALAAGGAFLLAQIGMIVVGCMLVRDLFVAPS